MASQLMGQQVTANDGKSGRVVDVSGDNVTLEYTENAKAVRASYNFNQLKKADGSQVTKGDL